MKRVGGTSVCKHGFYCNHAITLCFLTEMKPRFDYSLVVLLVLCSLPVSAPDREQLKIELQQVNQQISQQTQIRGMEVRLSCFSTVSLVCLHEIKISQLLISKVSPFLCYLRTSDAAHLL